MGLSKYFISLSALSLVSSYVNANPILPRTPTEIEWYDCSTGIVPGLTVECAKVEAPIDYDDPSKGTFDLHVQRIPAANGDPNAKTMFYNPGGPGSPAASSGASDIEGYYDYLNNITSGQFNLVGFDSRGVGQTSFRIWCFNSVEEEMQFVQDHIGTPEPDSPMNFDGTDEEATKALRAQIEAYSEMYRKLFEQCKELTPNLGYVGTYSVVKDLIYLADLIDGEDSLINYFGLSYGTSLGNYVAQMYPHRIGHMLLDAVVSPDRYALAYALDNIENFLETHDQQYDFMIETCLSVPEACPLLQLFPDGTKESIIEEIDKLTDKIYQGTETPSPDGVTRNKFYGFVNEIMSFPPGYYPGIASMVSKLQNISEGVTPELRKRSVSTFGPSEGYTNDTTGELIYPTFSQSIATTVIYCADLKHYTSENRPTTDDVVDAFIRANKLSGRFGATLTSFPGFRCHLFPDGAFDGAPRFENGFDSQEIKCPLLLASNTHDPSTPLSGAQETVDRLGKSGKLFVVDGYGHSTTPLKTPIAPCALETYQKFFSKEQIYPEDGAKCEYPKEWYSELMVQAAEAAAAAAANTTASA